MTDASDQGAARNVLAGLVPSPHIQQLTHPKNSDKERSKLVKSMYSTVPILLVGSMAMSMNLAQPVDASAKPSPKPKSETSDLSGAVRDAFASAGNAARRAPAASPATTTIASTPAPSSYRVVAGDTVSSIAGQYGLSTASVLALNGLGWKSVIFPGQVLKLTNAAPSSDPAPAAPPASTSRYTIVAGDSISGIAARYGLSTQTLLSANGLGWSSIIYPGQTIAIPGADLATGATPTAPDASLPEGSTVIPEAAPAPEQAAPAPEAVAPPTASGSYVIVSGDTISGIASAHGVTTQAVLDANGLSISSVIYPGASLVIPSASAPAAAPSAPSAPSSTGGNVTLMNDEMRANAAVIVQVGRQLGVSDYGIVIALATAMQESTLRNLNWGDRDSVGLFQQRPSTGWGTVSQLTDPAHAAALFYGGPNNPNRGYTRGLLDISGWESMSLTVAAQKVQISGYPDAYAKWESSARAWLSELG